MRDDANAKRWPRVSRERPCPRCGKPDRCTLAPDGRAGRCWRDDGGTTWHESSPDKRPARTLRTPGPGTNVKPSKVYSTLADAVAATRLTIRGGATLYGEPWRYGDASGTPIMAVARFDLAGGDKTCRPFHPVGPAGWAAGDPPLTRLPLYRLDALAAADPSARVYVCEGEKCADALASVGLLAVTSSHGASSAAKTDWSALAGRADVVLLPDRDTAGERYAADVLRLLFALSTPPARVAVVRLDDPRDPDETPDGFDVADWIELRDGDEPASLAAAIDAMADAATPELPGATAWPAGTDAGDDERPIADAPLGAAAADADVPRLPRPSRDAYYGLAGRIVDAIAPHTEADPAAILIQLLAAFGNAIGRGAYFAADGARHHGNLFAVIVGATSKGRKGTSWRHVYNVMAAASPTWAETRVMDGLSSGEGLIAAVRDPMTKLEPVKEKGNVTEYREVPHDPGVEDKRLLVQAGEFAQVLLVIGREGNTLSAVIRNAWDGVRLKTMTKSPMSATDAHVSIVGHITVSELARRLDATEMANGFGNRFLWACVGRSKLLPDGGRFDVADHGDLTAELAAAIEHGASAGYTPRDTSARDAWRAAYASLAVDRPGVAGDMLARAEAQVMRLALLYALLDRDTHVRPPHLRAALALWAYCEASAARLFGARTGDRLADQVEAILGRVGEAGATRTQLRDYFNRHKSSAELDAALSLLIRLGRATETREPTAGRDRCRYRITTPMPPTSATEAIEATEGPADEANVAADDGITAHNAHPAPPAHVGGGTAGNVMFAGEQKGAWYAR